MSSLPKYYFQDIPTDVMEEIASAMMASELGIDMEQMDDWFNRNNAPATIQDWYERAEQFISDRRLLAA